jgi:hypothetical protein
MWDRMGRATSPTKAGLDRPDMGHWFFAGGRTRQGCLSPLVLSFWCGIMLDTLHIRPGPVLRMHFDLKARFAFTGSLSRA